MLEDRRRVSIVTAVALGVGFAVVATWVEIARSLPGERSLLEALHRRAGRDWDPAMKVVDAASDTGPLAIVAVAVAAALVVARRWRHALTLVAVVAVVVVVNPLLKRLFARPRPMVRPIPIDVSQHAFPSGHAATSAALVGGLLLIAHSPRARVVVGVVGAAFLAVVAAAQLVLGAHLPSDIVAGWLWVGASVAGVMAVAARPLHGATVEPPH